jgi:hypothetical protein
MHTLKDSYTEIIKSTESENHSEWEFFANLIYELSKIELRESAET